MPSVLLWGLFVTVSGFKKGIRTTGTVSS